MPACCTSDAPRYGVVRSFLLRGAVVVALAWGCPAVAQAQSPPAAYHVLRFEREPGALTCVDEGELRAAIAAHVGYDPFVPTFAPPERGSAISRSPSRPSTARIMVVRIRRTRGGYEGTFSREGGDEHRGRPTVLTSQGDDCRELMSALAVGIAIAVDPAVLTRETPPVATTAAAPAPRSTPPFTAPRPVAPREYRESSLEFDRVSSPAPSTPEASRVEGRVGAGPSVAAGLLPRPSMGGRAFLGVVFGRFELDLEGAFDPPVEHAVAGGGAVEVSLASVALAPCLRVGVGLLCATASV